MTCGNDEAGRGDGGGGREVRQAGRAPTVRSALAVSANQNPNLERRTTHKLVSCVSLAGSLARQNKSCMTVSCSPWLHLRVSKPRAACTVCAHLVAAMRPVIPLAAASQWLVRPQAVPVNEVGRGRRRPAAAACATGGRLLGLLGGIVGHTATAPVAASLLRRAHPAFACFLFPPARKKKKTRTHPAHTHQNPKRCRSQKIGEVFGFFQKPCSQDVMEDVRLNRETPGGNSDSSD